MPGNVLLNQINPQILNVVQITDAHISADTTTRFAELDAAETLKQVIERINKQESPDLVLFTGDLVHKAEPQAYTRCLELLLDLEFPVYCLPGNHDDPDMMHALLNQAHISTGNIPDGRHWRIVMLNTVLAGVQAGQLASEELHFLEEQLMVTDKNILVALHHHPVVVNSPWMDTMILQNPEAFFSIVDRSPQVKAVICGHIHQEFTLHRGKLVLLGSPSTCAQFVQETDAAEVDDKPPAYRRLRLAADGTIYTEIKWLE